MCHSDSNLAVVNYACLTYLESSEELVITDSTVTVAVEMVYKVLGLFLAEVETIVNEAPAEVLHIKLAVTIVVHGAEDARNTFDSARAALQDLVLDLSDQVLD